jgi:hypothetical protein
MARGIRLTPHLLHKTHLRIPIPPASIPRHIYTMSSQHKQNKPDEKNPKFGTLPLSTSGPQDCALIGSALLSTPYFNKGAAFPAEERKTFKLTGLLPQHASSLDEQVKRAYQQYSSRHDDLAKNTFMTSLAGQNHVLYYRVSLPLFLYSASITTLLYSLFATQGSLQGGEMCLHVIKATCNGWSLHFGVKTS